MCSVLFLVNIPLKTSFPLISYFWTNYVKLLANGNVILFFFGCPSSLKHFFVFYCFPLYFALSYNIVYYSYRGQSIPSSMGNKWPCSFPNMISRNSRIDGKDPANTTLDRMHGIRSLFTACQLKRLDDINDDNDYDSYL